MRNLFILIISLIIFVGCKDNPSNIEIDYPIQVETWQIESATTGIWLGTSLESETKADTVIIRNTQNHSFDLETVSSGVDLTFTDNTITQQDSITSYAIKNLDESNLSITGDSFQLSDSNMRIVFNMNYACDVENPIKLGTIILSLTKNEEEVKVYKFKAPGFEHIISILACD